MYQFTLYKDFRSNKKITLWIQYHLRGVEFEWDENKADSNLQKHGIAFEEGAEVFLDPFHLIGDASTDYEQRDFIIGYSFSQRILISIYVERDERTRIISARRATRHERNQYEKTR